MQPCSCKETHTHIYAQLRLKFSNWVSKLEANFKCTFVLFQVGVRGFLIKTSSSTEESCSFLWVYKVRETNIQQHRCKHTSGPFRFQQSNKLCYCDEYKLLLYLSHNGSRERHCILSICISLHIHKKEKSQMRSQINISVVSSRCQWHYNSKCTFLWNLIFSWKTFFRLSRDL